MKCPYCGSENGRVYDSRYRHKKRTVYRRRDCYACGARFTTAERWDGLDENGDDGRTFRGMSVYPVEKLKRRKKDDTRR